MSFRCCTSAIVGGAGGAALPPCANALEWPQSVTNKQPAANPKTTSNSPFRRNRKKIISAPPLPHPHLGSGAAKSATLQWPKINRQNSLVHITLSSRVLRVGRYSVEIARQHQFEGQLVSAGRYAPPHAGFNIEELGVVIHHCPDLVELVVPRQEVAQGTVVLIFLDGHGPLILDDVVGDSLGWNEFQISESTRVVRVDDWIEDDVDRIQVQAYD